MSVIEFICYELICIVIQVVLFIPFFCIYKKDCKKIGKDKLAVSLTDKFLAWTIVCPIWIFPALAITG